LLKAYLQEPDAMSIPPVAQVTPLRAKM